MEQPVCPTDLLYQICYGYYEGTHRDGLCCYQRWSGSCCGRPFVVEGEVRSAAVATREDWGARDFDVAALDARTRALLAKEWLSDALMEHASVASFARFVLDLLAVGAPAALVERAQVAIGDEIAHARACFALAGRYAADALGPGPLATHEPGRSVLLEDLAAAAVREGCVGETLAALQAQAQLAVAKDERVRETLELIARDEENHAELAWAFVRWAIDRGGDSVRRAVREAFRAAELQLSSPEVVAMPSVDQAAFAAHGRLSPAALAACHRDGFVEVIAPCASALLSARTHEAHHH